MAGEQLPPNASRALPDFAEVSSSLALIDGEHVVVRISLRDVPDGHASDVASLVGELRHQERARYQDHEYAIATPYAELGPEHVAGGVLFLSEDTFESATLRTYDGNDHFTVAITTHMLGILIQDSDSTAP